MAYRALITVWFDFAHADIRLDQAGRLDYVFQLTDDLEGAKEASEQMRDIMVGLYGETLPDWAHNLQHKHPAALLEAGLRCSKRGFKSMLDRADWIDVYGDQSWDVYVDRTAAGKLTWMIRGIDAGGNQIHKASNLD